jgi:CRISPR-associated endonuclease Cas2
MKKELIKESRSGGKRERKDSNQNRKWSKSKKIERFTKKLTRNILEKTYDTSAITFMILKGIGKGPMNAFLKPTYYPDDPMEFLGEINNFKQHRLETKKMKQSIDRLREYGLIKENNNLFSLTVRGEKLTEKILDYKKRLEEEWDEKYRLVIFDIPEVDRKHRDWLREELYFLGYKKLQNSVFISKLSLTEDLIREIKERGIEDGVNYLLVEHVYDLKKNALDIKI